MTKTVCKQQASQPNLWVETHPLRDKPEGYECYVRISGEVQKIRIREHYPSYNGEIIYLDRWPLNKRPMFSTYTHYRGIEVIGEEQPAVEFPDTQESLTR